MTRTPYGQKIPVGKTVIHNTVSPDDLNKDEAADIALLGDTAYLELIEAVESRTGGQLTGDRAAVEAAVAEINGAWHSNGHRP